MSYTIQIYGASDDLVEIKGDVIEEFDSYDEPTYLLFNDGTQVKVEYDDVGMWAVSLIHGGAAQLEHKDAPERNPIPSSREHDSKVAPSYSDLVTLTWDQPLELVKHGHRKLSIPTPKQNDSLARANKVIEYLNGCGGFDDWYHDIDPDTQNEIVEGLARLLDGRSVDRKTFVITGTLSQPRAEVQARIESAGGYVSSALSSKTDYLIVGEDAGSKLEKARKMGTKILSEKELGGLSDDDSQSSLR